MSRVNQTLLNAKANIVSYIVLFILALFSRKMFISFLGDELIGLNATMQNVIGILNLAELGIWPATAYALYRYIHENDRERIKQIICLFGHLYRLVGYAILGISALLLVFMPLIFKSSGLSYPVIICSFLTFLYSALAGYFYSFKQILLVADQKNYVTLIITSSVQVTKVVTQLLLLAYVNESYYLWLACEVVFSTFSVIYINRYVNKFYPWLKLEPFNKGLLQTYKEITQNIKRLISHKFAGVVISQTDNILIFFFAGLAQVTVFSNYTLLIGRTASFFISVFNSSASPVGSLIASNDTSKIKQIFWELMSVRYLVTGIIIISTYYLINPFINLWLGPNYIIDRFVLCMLLFNTYIGITRMTVSSYIEAYGLFGNVWAAWTETGLNLIGSIILGYFFGIAGILLGTAISLVIIVCIWQPYYLITAKFTHESLQNYWGTVVKFMLELGIVWCLVHLIFASYFPAQPTDYLEWVGRAFMLVFISGTLYSLLIYLTSRGMQNFSHRMLHVVKEKFS